MVLNELKPVTLLNLFNYSFSESFRFEKFVCVLKDPKTLQLNKLETITSFSSFITTAAKLH